MTFTILAVSTETGEYGYAQSTSTPAAGDLSAAIVPGRGVLTVQAAGDPVQLELAKRLFEIGYNPHQVIKGLSDDPLVERRQLAVIDLNGRSAVRTGSEVWEECAEVVGAGHVATGNSLASVEVVEAMSRGYLESEGEDFAERLMRSLEAGGAAGGQPDGQTSSVIKAWNPRQSTLNLHVDLHPEPIGHLRRIFDWYQNLRPFYQRYASDNSSWDLDSWGALDAVGAPYFPSGGGWSDEEIAEREAHIRRIRAEDA